MIRNLLKKRPDLTLEQLNRTKYLMNSQVRDCLVTNYEYLIPSLELPDAGDTHVLAAAIVGKADVIVTSNLNDFPQYILNRYNLEAKHPDDFIADLLDLKPLKVMDAIEICHKRLKNPPKLWDEYLETLLKQRLSISVSMMRQLRSDC